MMFILYETPADKVLKEKDGGSWKDMFKFDWGLIFVLFLQKASGNGFGSGVI